MEDFQAMRAFSRVAELGSFTRAADELGLSRAMVSTHVHRLEKRFGLRLLNRTTRKVALTPAGSDYLGHCRRVFAELAAAEETLRRSKEQPTGRLCVDVPGSFGRHILLPRLPEFLARYPGIDLDLRFNERVVDLMREGVDLAVRAGTVTDPNLVALRVCGSRWITCASPAYLARHGRPQKIGDLAGHLLIGAIPPEGGPPRPWSFAAASDAQFEPKFRMTVNEAEAVKLAAASGAGITQTMDLLAARELADGSLVPVLMEHALPGPPLSIVHTPAAQRLARVRVVSDFLRGLLEYVMQRAALHTGLPPMP
ncbi:MAG: LysR family transcriptional regulator [Steroidobacteraceae bacterium]|nr:LysR family transcriptional regulator [Steroidobacteraceae bacterium]